MNTAEVDQVSLTEYQEMDSYSVVSWFCKLKQLFPITHAMVVGAGNGSGDLVRYLNELVSDSVTLIEAGHANFQQLERKYGDKENWSLNHRLVAPSSGPCPYYRTSVSGEDGIIEPGKLRAIWNQISIREAVEMEAISLLELINTVPVRPNWLMIDCLPSLAVLEGGASLISGLHVIVMRTSAECPVEGESLAVLTERLSQFSFRMTAFQSDRNPATGRALFVRDHDLEVRNLRSKAKQLETLLINSQYEHESPAPTLVDKSRVKLSDPIAAETDQDPVPTVSAVVDHLAKSAVNLRKRSHRLKSSLDLDNPARDEVVLLDAEIGVLQHELDLSIERGQFQSVPIGSQEVSSIEELNEQWLREIRSRAVSQLGQELWVLERCSFKRGGYFVEFGATNGILLSNTWLLEKDFGWHGICAEPNPKFFEELKSNRLCIVSPACIGSRTGDEVEFVFADVFGGMVSDIDKDEHSHTRGAYLQESGSVRLVTVSLHDFLIQNEAPKRIDYLSIDTEGSEFSILESFPFDQWDIRHITVEHNHTPHRQLIRELLESNGYQCQEAKWDDWYFRD